MSTIFFTLYFDSALEDAILRFWDVLVRHGAEWDRLQEHRPHISLAAYDVDDAASFDERLAMFVEKRSRIPIRLDHIGIFPEQSVVFLAPRPAHALLQLHASMLQEFSLPGDPPIRYDNMLVDNWTPHCTLARAHPDGMGTLIQALHEDWNSLCGTADGIGILEPPEIEDRLQLPFGA